LVYRIELDGSAPLRGASLVLKDEFLKYGGVLNLVGRWIPRNGMDIEFLKFLFCPWGFSQEGETGIHGWIEFKAANIDLSR
jgi:hypothetical protein